VKAKAQKLIGTLSDREIFLSGLFLYWAEGAKASPGAVHLTNTDPAMLCFFMRWFEKQGIHRSCMRIHLHLYADMDVKEKINFWSNVLQMPKSAFRKPYIKNSFHDKRRNYKGRFGHGTCNLIVYNRDLYELVMMGIEGIREQYSGGGFPVMRAV